MKLKFLLVLLPFLVLGSKLSVAQNTKTMSARQAQSSEFLGWVENQIVIKFDKLVVNRFNRDMLLQGRTGIETIDNINRNYNVKFIRQQFLNARPHKVNGKEFDLSTWYKLRFSGPIDIEQAVKSYSALANVIKAEPIGLHSVAASPNDPQFYLQWHLDQSGSLPPDQVDVDVDAPEAWDHETGNDDIIVAVMDSGVRYFHSDLGGADASFNNPENTNGNMWINWDEKNGVAGVDDDGNGYVDDWVGWDFVDDASSVWPGEDGDTPDNDPRDFNGHGTHCAGNVGAINNNGGGLCSVTGGWNPGSPQTTGNGVKVMGLRMGFSQQVFIFEMGVVQMDWAAEAFYYAANNGARIASCSWGTSNSGGVAEALDYFLAQGGLVFHAAGNDDSQSESYFDERGDVISVAATDSTDNGADFTNYGDWIDISAPGTAIWSTAHNHDDEANDYIQAMNGTSMATPIAAAVGALIWSQNPTWTAAQVEQHLYDTADDIEAKLDTKYKNKMGAGRVNAYNAVAGGASESISLTAPNGGEDWPVGSSQTITWTSSGTSGTVELEYSTNNGAAWTTIAASTADDGSYDWTIPDAPSTQCLVKVADTDGSPSDQSNSTFTISALNQAPSASDVVLAPSSPVTADDLTGSYIYSDPDSDPESGTEIRWYRDAALVASLNDQLSVSAGETSKGEQWYFTVKPNDGTEFGVLETSNTVTIGNTAPQAADVQITPASPYTTDDLQASYSYSDADNDTESGSEIRWYQNSSLVATYNDQVTVPSSATANNDEWYFTIKPNDGTDFGTLQTSATVTVTEQVLPQITDLVASVQGENILLEWTALSGATEYNVYRGTSYDFEADVVGGSNRIAERVTDQDPGTDGVQWTDTGNGADVVGDLENNYFYRVTGFVPSGQAQATSMKRDRDTAILGNVVMGGTPHTAYGQIFNSDASVPADADIEFDSYITARPGEVLTQASTGCSYSGGYWSVAVGNFSTAWSEGEILRTDVRNLQNGETGSIEVTMTSAGSDEAAALTLNSDVESDPSNIAGEFDVELIATATTDINELVVILNTENTRQEIFTAEDLAQAIPNCTDVYYWTASGQGQIGHPKGTPIENFEIKSGYPYIVNVSANTIWTNAGTYDMATFDLVTTSSTDINHIGVPFEKSDLTTAEQLGQDIPNCTDVYYWNVAGQGQTGHPVGTPVEDFAVKAAFPYYVNVTAATTWPEAPQTVAEQSLPQQSTTAKHLGTNVPHTVYGRLISSDEFSGTHLRAWIVGREDQVLTELNVGTGLDSDYWWVSVGNFETSWQADERVRVEIVDAEGSVIGRETVTLTHAGSDKADDMTLGVLSGVSENVEMPDQYELLPNYPNPFNPTTTLRFGLPAMGHVKVSIYAMNGQLIRTLVNGEKDAGYHHVVWDARNEMGVQVSSGLYFCRVESGDWHQTIKLVFAK